MAFARWSCPLNPTISFVSKRKRGQRHDLNAKKRELVMVSLNGNLSGTEVLISSYREAKVTDPCSGTLFPALRHIEEILKVNLPLCAAATLQADKPAPG